MNFDAAREQMVETQLKSRGIHDHRVLAAMSKVPRHEFVAPPLQHLAYEDGPLSIGAEQTISQPYMVALMSELLEVQEGNKTLEIGTGSGYQAAILAALGAQVFSVERVASLGAEAKERLRRLGYEDRVHCRVDDGCLGWAEAAPFDGALVAAAARQVPRPLVEQLRDGGVLVLPLGESGLQGLARIRKRGSRLESDYFGECRFVKLIGEYGWDE